MLKAISLYPVAEETGADKAAARERWHPEEQL
jgi:hypothetical protein